VQARSRVRASRRVRGKSVAEQQPRVVAFVSTILAVTLRNSRAREGRRARLYKATPHAQTNTPPSHGANGGGRRDEHEHQLLGAGLLGAGRAPAIGARVRRDACQDRAGGPEAGGARAQGGAGAHAGVRALLRHAAVPRLRGVHALGRAHRRRRHGVHRRYVRRSGLPGDKHGR
jgi:hypothetical protein